MHELCNVTREFLLVMECLEHWSWGVQRTGNGLARDCPINWSWGVQSTGHGVSSKLVMGCPENWS